MKLLHSTKNFVISFSQDKINKTLDIIKSETDK